MGNPKHWLLGATTGLLLASGASWAQISVGVSIRIAPPALPVYVQPDMPAAGYLWVPGYWAWDDNGYYWVPGEWVLPPQAGLLWTPGYWGWDDDVYVWHEGYWAPQVGFYGGVNYGYGYDGVGYVGGHWSHGAFYYNNAVNRIPARLHLPHVYHGAVAHVGPGHVSFNGGPGGVRARPTSVQLAVQREPHLTAVSAQREHAQTAQRGPHHGAGNAAEHAAPAGRAAVGPGERRIPEHAAPSEHTVPNRSAPERSAQSQHNAPQRGQIAHPNVVEHPSSGPHNEQARGEPAHGPGGPAHNAAPSRGHEAPAAQHGHQAPPQHRDEHEPPH